MPEYNWACHSCDKSNDKNNDSCEVCGCPAGSKLADVEAYKYMFSNDDFKCSSCGCTKTYSFSEDFYRYHKNGTLFRVLYLKTKCSCGSANNTHEFKVPFLRKLYRKYYNDDGSKWFFRL